MAILIYIYIFFFCIVEEVNNGFTFSFNVFDFSFWLFI